MILALWLLSLPFRLLAALGLRRSVILACLFALAVTAYSVAEDLGLLKPPVQAAPARKPATGQPTPSRAAVADIPAGYLHLYRQAGARYRISWPVLAAIGKVESDHGRSPLPGVRSGSNWAGAYGPMQIGCVAGSKAGNAWARYGHGHPTTRLPPSRPPPATWSTTAPTATWTGRSTPTTARGPTSPRSSSSSAATAVEEVGGGDYSPSPTSALPTMRQPDPYRCAGRSPYRPDPAPPAGRCRGLAVSGLRPGGHLSRPPTRHPPKGGGWQ